jgi:hypothetical protein
MRGSAQGRLAQRAEGCLMAKKKADPVGDWVAAAAKEDSPAIKALRDENRMLRRKISVGSGLSALIASAVEESFSEPANFVTPRPPKMVAGRGEEEVAVAHVSDVQFGKVTKSYDSAIASARLMEYAVRVGKCIERHRAYARVDDLRLMLGGDVVEGETVFGSQAFEIDSGVMQQAVRSAPEAIARMIFYWLGIVKRIHVVGVPGNHGRVGRKGEGNPSTNWDSVCMEVVRMMVMGKGGSRGLEKRVTWNIPDDWYAVDDVLGTKILLIHGDNLLTSVFGGSPFQRKMLSWRSGGLDGAENFDAVLFGHYHTYCSGEINNARWYCNGSTESDSNFAQRAVAARGWPKQRLQFYSREHGLVADRPIYLTSGLDASGNAKPKRKGS